MTAQNKAEAKQIPMNILMQTAVLLLICFAGEGISLVLPFAFPSSVISMILLFILLATKIIKLKQIEEVTGFLTKNMAFFFLPAGVEILENYKPVADKILPLFAVLPIKDAVESLSGNMYFVAGTVHLCMLVQRKMERGKAA